MHSLPDLAACARVSLNLKACGVLSVPLRSKLGERWIAFGSAFCIFGSPLPSAAGGWRLIDRAPAPSSVLVGSGQTVNAPLAWRVVSESQAIDADRQRRLVDAVQVPSQAESGTSNEAPKQLAEPLPVFSVGVGVRGGSQDKVNATVQGAIRAIQTGNDVVSSVSFRPSVIFPDSGCSTCGYEYRLAGTVDFFQSQLVSFYVGGGAAFNKDAANNIQNGKTFGMLTGGLELNLSKNFAITGNLNLINEPSSAQYGGLTWADAETSILFTARF